MTFKLSIGGLGAGKKDQWDHEEAKVTLATDALIRIFLLRLINIHKFSTSLWDDSEGQKALITLKCTG